jgi:hypothetical protein
MAARALHETPPLLSRTALIVRSLGSKVKGDKRFFVRRANAAVGVILRRSTDHGSPLRGCRREGKHFGFALREFLVHRFAAEQGWPSDHYPPGG